MASSDLPPVQAAALPSTPWRGLLTHSDGKTICRIASQEDAPFRLEANLFIKRIDPCATLQGLERLPHFSVTAIDDGGRSRPEWQRFLDYLWTHFRVGVVHASDHELVIQPDERPGEETANVATVFYAPLPEGIPRRQAPRPRVQEAARALVQPLPEGPGHMHPRYLETVAHAHSAWAFGALAELIDNARDAKASRVDISIEYGRYPGGSIGDTRDAPPAAPDGVVPAQPMLCVSDNGCGMGHKEVVQMLSLGHDPPPNEETKRIGRFGVGFKSGTMRLGDDVVVLTQCAESRTIAFLSRNLNANKQKVDIPVITYRKKPGGGMDLDTSKCSQEEERARLLIIASLTPFDSFRIGEEFLRLQEMASAGTGEECPEEDTTPSVEDGGGGGPAEDAPSGGPMEGGVGKGPMPPIKQESEEGTGRGAARAGTTPKRSGTGTRIFVLNLRKVLGHPELDWESEEGNILIRSRRPRTRPNQMCTDVPLDYNLKTYLKYMFLPSGDGPSLKMSIQGKMVATSVDLLAGLRKVVKRTCRCMGKDLTMRLGFSEREKLEGRCGVFLYWRGRLIEAFLRVGRMQYNHDACLGLLGVLETSTILENTQGGGVLNCKQRFLDTPEYQELLEWVTERVNKYWEKHFDDFTQQVVDPTTVDAPLVPANNWVQCDSCAKWRKLPAGEPSPVGEWFCFNPPLQLSCDLPQEEEDEDELTTAIMRDGRVTRQPISGPRTQATALQGLPGASARGDAAQGGSGRVEGAPVRRGGAAGGQSSSSGGGATGCVTVKAERDDGEDGEERPSKKPRERSA